MTRRRSDKGFRSRERLKKAAIELFFERGYHATPVRRLATRARLDGASVYYHFRSKQRLLHSILEEVMKELIATVERAIESAGPGPANQLRAAIVANATFHGSFPKEAAISDSELRGLSRASLARVIELRDRHEQIFLRILSEGEKQGFWHTDPRLVCFIIMAVCNEISHWYRPDGRLTLADIAAFDADFIINALRQNASATRKNNLKVSAHVS